MYDDICVCGCLRGWHSVTGYYYFGRPPLEHPFDKDRKKRINGQDICVCGHPRGDHHYDFVAYGPECSTCLHVEGIVAPGPRSQYLQHYNLYEFRRCECPRFLPGLFAPDLWCKKCLGITVQTEIEVSKILGEKVGNRDPGSIKPGSLVREVDRVSKSDGSHTSLADEVGKYIVWGVGIIFFLLALLAIYNSIRGDDCPPFPVTDMHGRYIPCEGKGIYLRDLF